jgi:DNA polymerase V
MIRARLTLGSNGMTTVMVEQVYTPHAAASCLCPLFLAPVAAGFPSPADDYLDSKLDLNQYLIKHEAATFFVRVTGDSMIGAGVHSGDLLIVDRALEPADNSVIIAVVNGELTLKRLSRQGGTLSLIPDNGNYQPIQITEHMDFEVWGVVTHVIHAV